jgi:streptogramin lyase/mono/diheme cytochrome c family protein
MEIPRKFFGLMVAAWLLQGCADQSSDSAAPSQPASAEHGQLSGKVTGSQPGVLPVVYAYNTDKDLAYTVFVVDGKYRAVKMIPGNYDVTIRPAIDQLEGFTAQTVTMEIGAGDHAEANFALTDVGPRPNYVGGMEYANAEIAPYDEVYPPGAGRDVLERTCHGCHTVQFFPYNYPRTYSGGRGPKNKAAWGVVVDRMHKGPAFGREGKASMFDPKYLPPEDRDILVNYLAEAFPIDGPPQIVQQSREPELDLAALEKAMFVEYIYRESDEYEVWPWPHQIDFDTDGNVWLAYTACCIVRFDPRTGEQTAYEGHGGGHGVAVDQTDGTVWYSGDVVRHLDPATGLVDHWVADDRMLGSNTQIFDSKGNLWMSLLAGGALGKWDRASDSVVYWEVPVLRSRPYGIIVDHKDKVWFADYHNGGVTRFDPETDVFKHFPLVADNAASSIRRPGVDSKGMIWAGTWGNRAFDNATLYRLNPDTGEVMRRKMGVPYAASYNAEADNQDNIWVSNDNYLTKYDQVTDAFTHFPIPVRSDSLKTTITRDDGIWFIYRNAGKYANYGGAAAVLYTDKDNIETLAAYHSPSSAGYALSDYQGAPAPKVQGGEREVPLGAQNAEAYAEFAVANNLMEESDAAALAASKKAINDIKDTFDRAD